MAKNWLAYGMVVFTLLIFIVLRPLPMTYWALYAVLLAPILSLLLALGGQRGFSVLAKLGSNYAEKSAQIPYILTVSNRSFLPFPCICIRFQVSAIAPIFDREEAYIFVPARKNSSVTAHVSTDYRGSYQVAPSELFLYDFLGLFRWKKELPQALSLTVVPRVHKLPSLPLDAEKHDAATMVSQTPHEDYSDISDLRKYERHDSYRKIHWKASAKRSELISKHFQETELHTAFLCIDNSSIHVPRRDALILEDQMMDALVSVMEHCTKLGYSVALDHMGAYKPEPMANFGQLFQMASHLRFDASGAFDTYLTAFLYAHRAHTNLILFLQDVSPHTISILQSHRRPGQDVIVFHFGVVDDEQLDKLQQSGITCIDFCNAAKKKRSYIQSLFNTPTTDPKRKRDAL